ncbi:ATP-dependent DNA ligase [Asanoa sp. NPDC049518]|uniref:ATP-dependent DNA ligase n=1 Tax=unclassified Asanoa TaxID=2685164 RepID=UPI0034342E44
MTAASTHELPVAAAWAYEPKWDGWRCLAWVRDGRVQLQTRNGKPIGGQFPDITRALRQSLPPGVVLDGELVVWDEGRQRSSFALLQRRAGAGRRVLQLARQYPAHYVVFDVLATGDASWLPAPLVERRALLEELMTETPANLVLCPHTTDPAVAREWIETWTDTGIEGVVAKRRDQPYRIGRSGWRKLRVRTTAEAVVAGVTGWITAPQTVLIGRYDSYDRLRCVDRITALGFGGLFRYTQRVRATAWGVARGSGRWFPRSEGADGTRSGSEPSRAAWVGCRGCGRRCGAVRGC